MNTFEKFCKDFVVVVVVVVGRVVRIWSYKIIIIVINCCCCIVGCCFFQECSKSSRIWGSGPGIESKGGLWLKILFFAGGIIGSDYYFLIKVIIVEDSGLY